MSSIQRLMLFVAVLVVCASGASFGVHNAHRLPPCSEAEAALEAETFLREYVLRERPVLLRRAAAEWPAAQAWRSDAALKEHFGRELVEVEEAGKPPATVALAEFIKVYNNSDVFLVSSLPHAMREDVLLPPCLQRGGFSNALDDTLLWMSAGGTQSQL